MEYTGKQVQAEVPWVRWHLDEFLRLIEIVRDAGFDPKVQAGDYRLDSPEEIKRLEPKELTKTHITGDSRQLLLEIDITRRRTTVWTKVNSPEDRGRYEELREFIGGRSRWPIRHIRNLWPLPGLGMFTCFVITVLGFTNKDTHAILWGTALGAVGALLMVGMLWLDEMREPAILLYNRNERPSFWEARCLASITFSGQRPRFDREGDCGHSVRFDRRWFNVFPEEVVATPGPCIF